MYQPRRGPSWTLPRFPSGLELFMCEQVLAGSEALGQCAQAPSSVELGDRDEHSLTLGARTGVPDGFFELLPWNIHRRLHASIVHA